MKGYFSLNNICLLMLGTVGSVFGGSTGNISPTAQDRLTGFIENKGQIHDQDRQLNSDVKYLYCSPGFNVQLRSKGFSYDTYREVPGETSTTLQQQKDPRIKIKLPAPSPIRKYHRVDVELIGSNPSPEITASGKSEVYMNYITDVESGRAVGDIHDYQQVLYKNIYPHVDLEFRLKTDAGNGPKAEYDFIVHPGGDASQIKLKYNGANTVGIEGAHLKVEVATGVFNEAIPHSYLKASNQEIQVNYIKTGDNTFSFFTPKGHYDSDLIIDPAPSLLWCTYYGGTGQDGASSITDSYLNGGIALDDTGNVYVTGFSLSASNIATSGAYQSSYSGSQEPFLAKFDPTGSTLLWGTYIDGGTCTVIAASPPTGTGVGCDASGNVYFVGITYTGQNVFIAKLSGTGVYDWSTTCGGDGAFIFGGPGIAVQPNGTVYVTGSNGVAYGPCYFAWYSQGFIAKYNTSGVQQWLHEVGPLTTSPADVFTSGNGIALDANSNIYITGMTSAATGIATSGTYLQTYGAGFGDNGGSVYVAKFDSTGTQQWGTYYAGITSCCFGGVNNEGASIAVDNTGVYITGVTCQNTGVATTGAYKTAFSGAGGNNANIFVAKFSLTGALDWGTYYGGAGSTTSTAPDAGMGIVTDGSGSVYVTGGTTSAAYIASPGSMQTSLSGTSNAFLANFNSSDGTLTWGTYFHGTSGATTLGTGIALNGKGKLFMVGETTETSGFSTPGVWQPNYGGDQDVFVASFAVGSIPLNATVHITQPACSEETNDTSTVNASGGTSPYTYLWTPGGQTGATVTGLNAGIYTVKVTDFVNATVVDTVKIIVPSPVALTVSRDTAICSGQNAILTAYATGGTPGYTYEWLPGSSLNATNDSSVVATPLQTTTYNVTVTDANSCQSLPKTVTVTIDSPFVAGMITAHPSALCYGDSAQLTVTGNGGNIQWQSSLDGNSFMDIPAATDTEYSAMGLVQTSYFRVRTTSGCGADTSAITRVLVNPLPVPVVSSADSIICSSDSVLIQTTTGYTSYLWNNTDTTSYTYADAAGAYWVTVTDTNGCSASSNHVNIDVYPVSSVSIVLEGDTLSSFGALAYQWYMNGSAIPGAVSSIYVARESGEYAVQITDTNGCKTESSQQEVTITGISQLSAVSQLAIYPNPFSNSIFIENNNRAVSITSIDVYDVLGEIAFDRQVNTSSGNYLTLDLTALPSGIYLIRVNMSTDEQYTQKIIKQ